MVFGTPQIRATLNCIMSNIMSGAEETPPVTLLLYALFATMKSIGSLIVHKRQNESSMIFNLTHQGDHTVNNNKS
jgi:hypothetical protein